MTRLKGAFTIKAQLADIKNPPVWRRIRINGTATFEDLHNALQEAFGWLDYHLHVFEERDAEPDTSAGLQIGPYYLADDEWSDLYGKPPEDEAETRLDAILPHYPRHLDYLYDFGDDWYHHLTGEAWQATPVRGAKYEILERHGAAPPEDCGGPWRFSQLRDCLAQAKKEGVNLETYDPSDLRCDLDYAVAALGSNFNPRNSNWAPDWYREVREPETED